MPRNAAVITRDRRILSSYAAGATAYEIARSENLDPAIVRRVLRSAGRVQGLVHPAAPPPLSQPRCTKPAGCAPSTR